MDTLETTLEVEDVPKIEQFCDHVFARMLQLFGEYKAQFGNIYKERCYEYFLPAPARSEPLSKTQHSSVRTQPTLPKYAAKFDTSVKKTHPMLINDSFQTAKLDFESPEASDSLQSSTDRHADVEMQEESADTSRQADHEMLAVHESQSVNAHPQRLF